MYYSGASWEYVKPDGSPGLGLFTSLAHPWGAAPSYVLPEYLLGIEATEAGYQTFTLRPMVVYLGLEEVSGRVPTPNSPIKSSWIMGANGTVVDIVVQEGCRGTFRSQEVGVLWTCAKDVRVLSWHVDGRRFCCVLSIASDERYRLLLLVSFLASTSLRLINNLLALLAVTLLFM
jgi:hypothetical protein